MTKALTRGSGEFPATNFLRKFKKARHDAPAGMLPGGVAGAARSDRNIAALNPEDTQRRNPHFGGSVAVAIEIDVDQGAATGSLAGSKTLKLRFELAASQDYFTIDTSRNQRCRSIVATSVIPFPPDQPAGNP